MPSSLGEPEKARAEAQFDSLISEFRLEYPQLTIRSVIEEYDWRDQDHAETERVLMGKLRHDVIDLVALDGAEREFGIDHPVVFFDADTKQIAKSGIKGLSDTLTAPDAREISARLETHYLFDEDTGFYEDGTITDARKLADSARAREQAVHPRFRDETQVRRIAAAILQPGVVRVKNKAIPMPDPTLLLKRYHLPLPREDEDK